MFLFSHLIHAGGFDLRVQENVDHFNELKFYVNESNLTEKVSLLRSISDVEKSDLLRKSYCLLYTPLNEHFGIVPIEAMYCGKPGNDNKKILESKIKINSFK